MRFLLVQLGHVTIRLNFVYSIFAHILGLARTGFGALLEVTRSLSLLAFLHILLEKRGGNKAGKG